MTTQPPRKTTNHGAFFLGLIAGTILLFLSGSGILLLPIFWLVWAVCYAGTAATNHRANERIANGIPERPRRWNGLIKLEDHQKPSWW